MLRDGPFVRLALTNVAMIAVGWGVLAVVAAAAVRPRRLRHERAPDRPAAACKRRHRRRRAGADRQARRGPPPGGDAGAGSGDLGGRMPARAVRTSGRGGAGSGSRRRGDRVRHRRVLPLDMVRSRRPSPACSGGPARPLQDGRRSGCRGRRGRPAPTLGTQLLTVSPAAALLGAAAVAAAAGAAALTLEPALPEAARLTPRPR